MKIKYAIYKGIVGLYAKEYFDKIDPELFERRGVLGWYNITPDRLPIVVNSAGGRCSFYPVEGNFVEIIKVDENQEPLTREQQFPKNSPEFYFGWISPDGDTYNSGFEGHSRCADLLCKEMGIETYSGERYLEENGWVKILREAPYTPENKKSRTVYAKDLILTKKQADVLFGIGMYEDENVKLMVEISQNKW